MTRPCSRCGVELPSDRAGYYCKPCISAQNRESHARHREARTAAMREKYRKNASDPTFMERKRERERNYYRKKYANKKLELGREWRRNNPEAARSIMHRHRAAIRGNGSIAFTPEQWDAKLAYWGWKCWICRTPLVKYHRDHVKPISKGGMDCLSNSRPACAPCNIAKGNRWPYHPERDNSICKQS